MDHADVLDRLATAFSEPGKLASLDADLSVEGRELQRHLAGCDSCRSELAAWRLTSLALAAATPESLRAPDEARDRVLAAVAATGVARGGPRAALAPSSSAPRLTSVPPRLTQVPGWFGHPPDTDRSEDARLADTASPAGAARTADPKRPTLLRPAPTGRSWSQFRWLAVAAAVAVLVFVGGALLGPKLGLTQEAQVGGGDLASVVTFMNGIVQQPDHISVALFTPDGKPGGSVLVDPATGNLAVVSTELLPGGAQTYDCFVGRGSTKTMVGLMHFSNQTSFWIGKVASLSSPGAPGDWFEVRLGGIAGALSLHGNF